MFPTKYEILDDLEENVLAEFEAFDDSGFTVKIDDKVLEPEELFEIADLLNKAHRLLDEGV